jgi:hypothetical protein
MKQIIETFLSDKKLAILGVSPPFAFIISAGGFFPTVKSSALPRFNELGYELGSPLYLFSPEFRREKYQYSKQFKTPNKHQC